MCKKKSRVLFSHHQLALVSVQSLMAPTIRADSEMLQYSSSVSWRGMSRATPSLPMTDGQPMHVPRTGCRTLTGRTSRLSKMMDCAGAHAYIIYGGGHGELAGQGTLQCTLVRVYDSEGHTWLENGPSHLRFEFTAPRKLWPRSCRCRAKWRPRGRGEGGGGEKKGGVTQRGPGAGPKGFQRDQKFHVPKGKYVHKFVPFWENFEVSN